MLVVSLTHTVANPGTMMVKHFNTVVTVTTVRRPKRPYDITSWANPVFPHIPQLHISDRFALFLIGLVYYSSRKKPWIAYCCHEHTVKNASGDDDKKNGNDYVQIFVKELGLKL